MPAQLRFGGGLNQLDDELIHPEECIDGENFELETESRHFHSRASFDLKGTATNAGVIRGIMQLVKRDNSETTLVQSSELVYLWDGAASFTAKTPTASTPVNTNSLLRGTYWSLDDLLIITDVSGLSPVWQWNGTTMTEMVHGIAGVSELFAKYSVVWQNRVWLFNIKTDASLNPHMILASEYENYDNYDNAVTPTGTSLTFSDPFFLLSPDLKPINGVATFFDSIVISTVDGKLFRLTGNDATDYAISEYYSGSAAIGMESLINIGNDILYTRIGGKVERLSATDQYGDTAADDVSRKIPTEVVDLASALSVYDQRKQRVCFFTSNKILVLDKFAMETSELSPWSKWTTQMASNLNVEAATFMKRPGLETYTIYFGGPSGQVYDYAGSGTSDAGTTLIKTYRKTGLVKILDTMNAFVEGRITYRRKGVVEFNMEFEWTDEYADTLSVVPLKDTVTSPGTFFWGSGANPAYWSGDYYWNEGGVLDRVSTVGFSAVGKGPSFFLTTTVNTTNDWLINDIETT